MSKMPDGWVSEEPGWWVHVVLGGICREDDRKWYAYPKHLPESERLGPFATAHAAAIALQPQAMKAVV